MTSRSPAFRQTVGADPNQSRSVAPLVSAGFLAAAHRQRRCDRHLVLHFATRFIALHRQPSCLAGMRLNARGRGRSPESPPASRG